MRLLSGRSILSILSLLALVGWARCERDDEQDASGAFLEAARTLFADKDAINGLQGMASAFVQSDAGRQMGDALSDVKSAGAGPALGDVLSGLGSLMSGAQNSGFDFSALGSIVESLAMGTAGTAGTAGAANGKRSARDASGEQTGQGFDLDNILNIGGMLLGQGANSDLLMGMVPMLLENLAGSGGGNGPEAAGKKTHDHSGHSWYLPPILEHVHVVWDHFSNSELGQTLWKKSGLSNIIEQMSDEKGRIQYEIILDSFENPTIRRRWIRSLTNFVAEWISHVSEPTIQQRYLTTAQFVGNSFLKSQGYPKTAMFDAHRPTESLARVANTIAKRHLGVKIDSMEYLKPAVAYVQELIALASEKGFIMSRINARELSNKLSDTINHDIVAPILKAYRAYKWAIKTPRCASQILCTINERTDKQQQQQQQVPQIRELLARVASFPAAWAVSNKSGINFWSLYGAVMENEGCINKFPADCSAFHEEEIRATTESAHSEL